MAGTLTIDALKASSGVLATQNGMTGIAKAWAFWTGSTGAIIGSFNVSSITRSGAGVYTVNFATAMPNANYATVSTGAWASLSGSSSLPTVNSVNVTTGYSTNTSGGASSADYNANVAIFSA